MSVQVGNFSLVSSLPLVPPNYSLPLLFILALILLLHQLCHNCNTEVNPRRNMRKRSCCGIKCISPINSHTSFYKLLCFHVSVLLCHLFNNKYYKVPDVNVHNAWAENSDPGFGVWQHKHSLWHAANLPT